MKISRPASLFATLSLLASLVVGFNAANAAGNPNCNAVDGNYIVSFAPGVNVDNEIKGAPGRAISAKYRYTKALNGFAAQLTAEQVCAFQNRPNIENIELDGIVSIDVTTQESATWGLDRIDQRVSTLDTKYKYDYEGAGVRAYIIDTGIRSSHSEFMGRVVQGDDEVKDGNGTEDCNGHGTHVSGTVGGTTYGVAKKVTLVPVRVLSCSGSGSTSGVIAGINWVATDVTNNSNANLPAVANLSLGGSFSAALNSAIANLVSSGVTVAVAAGNSNANACNYSPASEPSAITVGATTSTDSRASYSNYGTCLDVFAPGSSITSSWYTSTTATNTISGTSMASPHVAGVAALYLSKESTASPATVGNWIASNATPSRVASPGTGSPNLLLANDALQPINTLLAPAFTSISGTSPKRGTARATWSVNNGGSQMIDYKVELKQGGNLVKSSTITTTSTSGTYTFSTVKAGSGYTITVSARNGVGTTVGTSSSFSVS